MSFNQAPILFIFFFIKLIFFFFYLKKMNKIFSQNIIFLKDSTTEVIASSSKRAINVEETRENLLKYFNFDKFTQHVAYTFFLIILFTLVASISIIIYYTTNFKTKKSIKTFMALNRHKLSNNSSMQKINFKFSDHFEK